jgi:hypothetical protein
MMPLPIANCQAARRLVRNNLDVGGIAANDTAKRSPILSIS